MTEAQLPADAASFKETAFARAMQNLINTMTDVRALTAMREVGPQHWPDLVLASGHRLTFRKSETSPNTLLIHLLLTTCLEVRAFGDERATEIQHELFDFALWIRGGETGPPSISPEAIVALILTRNRYIHIVQIPLDLSRLTECRPDLAQGVNAMLADPARASRSLVRERFWPALLRGIPLGFFWTLALIGAVFWSSRLGPLAPFVKVASPVAGAIALLEATQRRVDVMRLSQPWTFVLPACLAVMLIGTGPVAAYIAATEPSLTDAILYLVPEIATTSLLVGWALRHGRQLKLAGFSASTDPERFGDPS